MPYINVKVSTEMTEAQMTELKAALGQAITTIPGKSETYLMVCIEDRQRLWLGGDCSEPKAFVDVRILGKASSDAYSKMTGVLCGILEKQLGIPPAGVYVCYSEFDNWGWNGRNF